MFGIRQRFVDRLFRIAGFVVVTSLPVSAEDILRPGVAIVTGFSGLAAPAADLSKGNDSPTILSDGASAEVLYLTQVQKPTEGSAIEPDVRLSIPARTIGQVFGVEIAPGVSPNTPPDVFLTATSAFGLRIVAADPGGGLSKRLKNGAPDAQWMPGQFGADNNGGPGSVWKLDGKTGKVSLFATLGIDGNNAGPGLGNIAFDPETRQLYVSDLESGMIHRLDTAGVNLGYYDHGVDGRTAAALPPVDFDPSKRMSIGNLGFDADDPDTWGFAAKERRVWGLTVFERRLYYAVADGPQVWSVGLNADGSVASDARVEVELKETAGVAISDIEFDAVGVMYLAERGPQLAETDNGGFVDRNGSVVLRFRRLLGPDGAQHSGSEASTSSWRPVEPQAPPGTWSSSGGLALGRGIGSTDRAAAGGCQQMLWSTGESTATGRPAFQGLQGSPSADGWLDRTGSAGSYLVQYGGPTVDPKGAGLIGDVDIVSSCPEAPSQFAPTKPPVELSNSCTACALGGNCSCRISLRNNATKAVDDELSIEDKARILSGPQSGRAVAQLVTPDAPGWSCRNDGQTIACRLSPSQLPPGGVRHVDLAMPTNDLVDGGNFGLRNCATFRSPPDRSLQQLCRDFGSELSVEKTGPEVCVAGQPCQFDIVLTNVGPTVFDREVAITDIAVVGGGPASGRVEISPSLGCEAEPTGLPFTCTTHIVLAPGERRRHAIKITFAGSNAARDSGVNCVVAVDPLIDPIRLMPGLPPEPLQGPGFSCVPFMLGQSSARGDGEGRGPAAGGSGGNRGGPADGAATKSSSGDPSQQDAGPQGTGVLCPADMLADGSQCFCLPRSFIRVNGRCAAPPGRGSGLGGGGGSGAEGSGDSGDGGESPGAGGGSGSGSACAQGGAMSCCAQGTVWNGMRCDSVASPPGSDFGVKSEPCAIAGQVRRKDGTCGCPEHLEEVKSGARTTCCRSPCGQGETRDVSTGECRRECEAGLELQGSACVCPPGVNQTHFKCQPIPQIATKPISPAPETCPPTMVLRGTQCSCPEGKSFDGRSCRASRPPTPDWKVCTGTGGVRVPKDRPCPAPKPVVAPPVIDVVRPPKVHRDPPPSKDPPPPRICNGRKILAGQACPPPGPLYKNCNGTRIPVGQHCPPPVTNFKICAGRRVPVDQACVSPPPQFKVCYGRRIPLNEACARRWKVCNGGRVPIDRPCLPMKTCRDGTTVPQNAACPALKPRTKVCNGMTIPADQTCKLRTFKFCNGRRVPMNIPCRRPQAAPTPPTEISPAARRNRYRFYRRYQQRRSPPTPVLKGGDPR